MLLFEQAPSHRGNFLERVPSAFSQLLLGLLFTHYLSLLVGLVIVGATAWDEGLDVGLRDYA